HRREIDGRAYRAQQQLERGAALELRRLDQGTAVVGQEIERDERCRRRQRQLGDPRRGRVQALLQGVEVEAAGADDDDLAVDDRAVGQPLEKGGAQLGE